MEYSVVVLLFIGEGGYGMLHEHEPCVQYCIFLLVRMGEGGVGCRAKSTIFLYWRYSWVKVGTQFRMLRIR